MTQPVRADEGRRLLRNAASFGAFLMSPVIMWLMIRALGPGGYGRWWSAFVVLEAAGIFGNFGTDLYIRREVSRLSHEGRDEEIPSVVGSAMFVVGVFGLALLVLQVALAVPICSAQDDPELLPYLLILGVQPLMNNLAGAMGAALQSRSILGALAVLRGIVFPLITAGVLFLGWSSEAPPWVTLAMLTSFTFLALVCTVVLYSRHLPLAATLRCALRPTHARAAIRFGGKLIVPVVLFVVGGKLDLYILGTHQEAVVIGVYAGCLHIAAMIPNTRALLDPIIQERVGALYGADPAELGRSLQRLTRLCVFALAPSFVMLLAIGKPALAWLLGTDVTSVDTSLIVLTVSQLIGSLAIASWVVPMMLPGRILVAVAAVTLIVKLVLLLVLVPSFGVFGAAIAASAGTIIAMQGQALVGAHVVGHRPYGVDLLPVLFATIAIGIAGRLFHDSLATQLHPVAAAVIGAGATLLVLGGAVLVLLRADERDAIRRLLGLAPRAVPPP